MQQRTFLAGVVEGFYGRPWTMDQRFQLFERMPGWGLNTYCYAPKDDLNHRAIWRDVYGVAEIAKLRELIQACQQQELRFIYGLSPGLDIQFSDPRERDCVKRRFAQLIDAGCSDFALLFDDLPGRMSDEDQRTYASVAAAQASVANDAFAWAKDRTSDGRFLFCPTPYCDRMDRWRLGGEDYLGQLGQDLELGIDVLWTGPEIVSAEIPVDSIRRLEKRLRRAPVIWDNLHANDYDGRRLFAGPYAGRSPELRQHVSGILANPNNEFVINDVPLTTLGAYVHATETWDPRQAYLAAISEWHRRFETVSEPISLDDLVLLADCFYLPFENGAEAQRMFQVIESLVQQPCPRWGDLELQFDRWNQRVQRLFDQLTQLRDRELFYAWSRRAWDLKEELQLIRGFLDAKRQGNEPATVETHLMGTYRGGLVARLQALLEMDESGRFRTATRKDG